MGVIAMSPSKLPLLSLALFFCMLACKECSIDLSDTNFPADHFLYYTRGERMTQEDQSGVCLEKKSCKVCTICVSTPDLVFFNPEVKFVLA